MKDIKRLLFCRVVALILSLQMAVPPVSYSSNGSGGPKLIGNLEHFTQKPVFSADIDPYTGDMRLHPTDISHEANKVRVAFINERGNWKVVFQNMRTEGRTGEDLERLTRQANRYLQEEYLSNYLKDLIKSNPENARFLYIEKLPDGSIQARQMEVLINFRSAGYVTPNGISKIPPAPIVKGPGSPTADTGAPSGGGQAPSKTELNKDFSDRIKAPKPPSKDIKPQGSKGGLPEAGGDSKLLKE